MEIMEVFIFLGGLAAIWLCFGFFNYLGAIDTLDNYTERMKNLEDFEKEYKETSMRAEFFLQRQNLKENFPQLDVMSDGYKKDPAQFKRQLAWEYVKAGPVYNIWK